MEDLSDSQYTYMKEVTEFDKSKTLEKFYQCAKTIEDFDGQNFTNDHSKINATINVSLSKTVRNKCTSM